MIRLDLRFVRIFCGMVWKMDCRGRDDIGIFCRSIRVMKTIYLEEWGWRVRGIFIW